MTAEARVLLLSYAFPPIALPEAYLAAKTMGHIPDISVDVIASQVRGKQRNERSIYTWRDHSLDSYVAERFGTIVRVPEPMLVQRVPVHRIPIIGAMPDVHRFSNSRAINAAKGLDPSRYLAIVTRSQWHSVHLVGLALKRSYPSLRWIAHFSDPWVDNPYVSYGRIGRAVNRRLEQKVAVAADRLVFTSDLTMHRFLEKYPDSLRMKGAVVPHTFDRSLYSSPGSTRPSASLTLRYLGQFYGRRSPEPLFRALSILLHGNRGILDNIRFEFVGGVPDTLLDTETFRSLPPGLVSILPAVEFVDSLRLMSESSALLVIDAPGAESVFLPSKLIDYLGAHRPIFGVTPPGAAADLLTRLGYPSADPSNPTSVAAALGEFLERIRATGAADWGDNDVRAEFEASRVGTTMRELIVGS